jgi:hypothetical protein
MGAGVVVIIEDYTRDGMMGVMRMKCTPAGRVSSTLALESTYESYELTNSTCIATTSIFIPQ